MIAKRAVSAPASLPAPIGGLNTRDALPAMPPTDAVVLTNFYPATTECQLRQGYTKFATGISGQVETLMNYAGALSDKLFCIAGGKVYDVTSGGAVGAASLSGLTNSRWQYCNISTAGGNFLSMANGVDAPRLYNGSAWSTPAITGVTATKLNSPTLYMNRQFFIEEGTLKTWYLPVQSIAGAANAIDISSFAYKGGHIVAHATWTIDAGNGVNDHYAIVTSKGQVIVYQGTDPSSASTWSMVGVWDLGTPLGSRCLHKYAGDLLYISQDGLVPMSSALQSSRVNPKVALTDKIQFTISEDASLYGGNFGWQVMYVAPLNQLWLNVPYQVGQNQQQFAMNTISGAWANYQGWNANCFEMFLDSPYFGGNGYVAKAWNGFSDAGVNISGYAIQAFNPFADGGHLKRFTMARPMFRTNGSPAVYAGVAIDFDISDKTSLLNFAPSTSGIWDTAKWDLAVWGGDLSVYNYWQGANGVGYYGAPVVKVLASNIDVRWVSTSLVIEQGAIL